MSEDQSAALNTRHGRPLAHLRLRPASGSFPQNQRVKDAGICGRLYNARCAVPLPMPVSRWIVPQECPWERREAILEASTATLGLPSVLPLALAFLIPARTRSAIRLRSSSATAPRTVKTRSE